MAEALQVLKLPELKEECRKLGLPVTGKKSELIDRILAAQGAELSTDGNGAGDAHEMEVEEDVENGATEQPEAAAAAPEAAAEPAAAAPEAAEPAAATETEQAPSKRTKIVFEPAGAAPSAAAAPQAAASKEPAPAAAKSADLDKIKVLTAEERAALRADKFKGAKGDDKLKERAARFGLTAPQPNPADDDAKKAERRKRFNMLNDEDKAAAAAKQKLELLGDEETRRKRMERFGVVGSGAPELAQADAAAIRDPEKLRERQKRFGIEKMSSEARKKARLERFGPVTATE